MTFPIQNVLNIVKMEVTEQSHNSLAPQWLMHAVFPTHMQGSLITYYGFLILKQNIFFPIFFFGKALKDWDSDNYGSAQGAWYLELVARHIRLSTYVCERARHNVWAQRAENPKDTLRLGHRGQSLEHSEYSAAAESGSSLHKTDLGTPSLYIYPP